MRPIRTSPSPLVDRRRLIAGAGGLGLVGLGGCAVGRDSRVSLLSGVVEQGGRRFAPVRASMDRVFDITVCLRPFRAQGPRLDTETIGDTLVVHNYGHGGSGWSLSWGSGTIAVRKAMASSPAEIAVLGCGALGLTAAIARPAGRREGDHLRPRFAARHPLVARHRHAGRPTPASRSPTRSRRTSRRSGRRWRGSRSTPTEATSACPARRWSGRTATTSADEASPRWPRRSARRA